MRPEARRELALALIELVGTFYPRGSEERKAWANLWDEAKKLPGTLLDEEQLAWPAVAAMRTAAHNLQRAVDQFGEEGPMAELFEELQTAVRSQTAKATGVRRQHAQDLGTRIRELRANRKTIAEIAVKVQRTTRTVERHLSKEKPPT